MCDINKKQKKKETAEKLLLRSAVEIRQKIINKCLHFYYFLFYLFRKDRQRFSSSGCDSPRRPGLTRAAALAETAQESGGGSGGGGRKKVEQSITHISSVTIAMAAAVSMAEQFVLKAAATDTPRVSAPGDKRCH